MEFCKRPALEDFGRLAETGVSRYVAAQCNDVRIWRRPARAIAFATENAEVAREFAAAKDMKDVLTLQSRYAQTQLQSFACQAQELGKLMTDTMRDLQSKG